jgi:hypothetical protein
VREGGPRTAIRRWIDSFLLEHMRDCSARDLVPQIAQSTLNSRTPPGRIFMGETENETTNCLRSARPTGRAFTRAVIFPCDQAPVPPEQSFRRDDWNDFSQRVDASVFRFSCEPDTLTIGKARLPSELFPKDFDLLPQVIYQELLVSVNLAGQEEQAELQNVHRYSSAALSRPSGPIFGHYGMLRYYHRKAA